jgi:hypothetical protein
MARRRSLRSQLYRDARILGNVEAASQGPLAYGRRYARRRTYAASTSLTRSFLRSLDLSH